MTPLPLSHGQPVGDTGDIGREDKERSPDVSERLMASHI